MTATLQRSELAVFFTTDAERRAGRLAMVQPMVLQRTYDIDSLQVLVMLGCWLVGMLEWVTLVAEHTFENTVFVSVMAAVFMCIAMMQIRGSYGTVQQKK